MQYLQWIPASERMPNEELNEFRAKYGQYSVREFIVYISGAAVSTVLWYDGHGFYESDGEEPLDEDYDDREYYDDVTHWMSLPPTPEKCKVEIDLGDSFEASYDMLDVILT